VAGGKGGFDRIGASAGFAGMTLPPGDIMARPSAVLLHATLLAALLPASVFAAGQMKPGLWEMSIKSDAMKNMPKIPPEQIEQMKKMGIAIPDFQEGGIKTKVCISKEMAERGEAPGAVDAASGCKAKNTRQSGNSYAVDIVCDGPDMKGEGRAQGSFISNESFTSTYNFKGTMHGQPVNQRHDSSGKWLGANCGDVKPMSDMTPAK
jgi:hypothetical protein